MQNVQRSDKRARPGFGENAMGLGTFSRKSLASKYWNEYTETMPRERLDVVHLRRIRKLIAYAYEHVPFYRQLYDKAGFRPDDIRSLDDFNAIVPVIDKMDLVEAQQANPPWGDAVALEDESNLYRFQTSGSTGVPMAIPVSYYSSHYYGEQKTEQLLYERILVRIAVEIEPPGTLPRYELKAKRFFDHRQR